MQTFRGRLAVATFALLAIASCGSPTDNPYAAIGNPPLMQGRLHTLTIVTDTAAVAAALEANGYAPIPLDSSAPAAIDDQHAVSRQSREHGYPRPGRHHCRTGRTRRGGHELTRVSGAGPCPDS